MDEQTPKKVVRHARAQAEQVLRLHQVVRTVVRVAASATDSATLLQRACQALVEGYPFSQSWAFLTDTNGRLHPSAPIGMTSAFELLLAEVAQGRPPACLEEALNGHAPARYESAGAICTACPVRTAHDEGEVWVIPLRFGEKCYGVVFVLGPESTKTPNSSEIPILLQDAGEAMAAGLHRLSQDAARDAVERRFQRLVDNLMGMVYQCRHDGRWTMEYLSAGAFDLTGYRPEQLLDDDGPTYASIIHPDDRDRVRDAIREALAEDRPHIIRYRILHANGSVRHVVERGHRMPNGGPDTAILEGIVTDVTDQVEQEELVRRTGAELEAFFDVALDLFCITDHEGRVLKLNRRWEQVLGYPQDELIGVNLLDLVHPDDRQETAAVLGCTVAGESVAEFVNRHRCADGSYRYIEWQAHPHGSVNFAAARDITQRREREQAILESEARFRSLIEGAPEAIFVQLEGKFDYLNQAACTLFGVETPEDLIGQPVIERFHPDQREVVLRRIKRLNEKQESVPSLEDRILRVDGFEVPVEVSAVPYAHDGRRGALVFMHDLTLRKRVEEKHRELEGQLHQAQKMESVGQLAGGVAHDFNNLLVPILGHAEILANDLPPVHPAQPSLKEILAAAERAREVASQLLSFSRKKPLEMGPVDLNTVVAGFQRMLGTLLGENISVTLNLAAEPLLIKGDSAQLEQVLLNLAVNARDAMPNGGRFLIETAAIEIGEDYIGERPLVPPGDYALLAVTDEGCGMDEATRNRIFDPFFTTKELDKGTGLGLSNVYGIVKQHEGQIWVYSEVGHGTTFKVYIPLSNDAISAPARCAPAVKKEETATALSSACVLVLEDQAPVRLLVVKMLERMGHVPLEAATLAEARALAAETSHIDLMISDVILPDGKGPDAYADLHPLHPSMGIIFMSGYTEHVVVDDKTMAERFLQKPFTANKLRDAVTRALGAPPPPG